MIVWRLATTLYPPLTGEGARRTGGRWNSPGVPLVYTSSSLSLALVETLVHIESDELPDSLTAFEIFIPDNDMEELADVPEEWFADPLQRQSRRYGDSWATEMRSLCLRVPSSVVRTELNILINPMHPAFQQVMVRSQRPFRLDTRLG